MDNDNENIIGVVRERGIDYDVHGEPISWIEVYVKIKVAFRQKALKLLKGPKLSCFLCVALHVGDEGTAHPSIDTIMRETGYSRSVVCNALEQLENLGFIEKQRRKHDSTLYHVKGYVWFGSDSKPTLLGESHSSLNELSEPKSKGSKRLPTKRLPNEPKDKPSSRDKPPCKETSSAQSADRRPNGLFPDTILSRIMFGRLQANAKAEGRKGPCKFRTLEQKRKFDEAAIKLDEREFERALTVGLEQGINSVARMTNWIAKWDGNRQGSARRPRDDPDKFDRARAMTLERLERHGDQ